MKKQITRVLIMAASMNMGGAETFIMKVFRKIDREKIMFDFMVNEKKPGVYDKEIRILGGKIYQGAFKSRYPVKSFYYIYRTVKDNNFKVVLRLSAHPLAFIDLLAARCGGADKLIIRSTNTKAGGIISNILACITRPILNRIADIRIAPSTEAGTWLFGKRQINLGNVIFLQNGIELEKFHYCEEIRNSVRRKLGIEESFVVGHVGRFHEQKNHLFLIKVFNEIVKNNPSAVLLLIGEGEREEEIRKYVEALELTKYVLFLGKRMDVGKLMQAMDIFLFPSFYEGMPNTVLEAQAVGLPCFISDTITEEVKLTDLVTFLSLKEDALKWCKHIMGTNIAYRYDRGLEIKKKGYSIEDTVNCLSKIIEE
ncbi:MAG: glycosyltransferase family 1 protein [Lachnospiraceae bacterium]|nr:glycosyltransferase family 1 protein [Lachnospiraceae bacterium]